MPLTRKDANRILRFCLGADDSASAGAADDGACLVTIALCRSSYEVHTFPAATYEEALRAAAGAGVLKQDCVDKQIAFLATREESAAAVAAAAVPLESPAAVVIELEPAERSARAALFLDTARAVGALLHETQRERGISALFAGSEGRLFGNELPAQRAASDARRAAVAALAARTDPALPAAVARRLKRAEALTAGLVSLRNGIDDGVIKPARLLEVYTAANAELLAAVDACMVATVDGPRRSIALATVALLHAKEKTGIERARIGVALLSQRMADERLALAALMASQASYLHIFSAAAPPAAEQLLRRLLASPPAAEVRRIEERLCAVSGEHVVGVDARAWFAVISRKIEMLGDVGEVVLGFLADG
jgi:hypothetical protein